MMNILENIIGRLLFAIIPSVLWTITSFIITYGLYKIKNKDIPDNYYDDSIYMFITNYILIFLSLLFFYRENIELF